MPGLPVEIAARIGDAALHRVEEGEAGALVFRIDRPGGGAYLKYGEGRIADDVVDEFVRSRWLASRIPCARVIHFACDRERAWLLSGAVPGRTGDAWLAEDARHLSMVIDACADMMQRLHALPVDACPFDTGVAMRLSAARRLVAAGLVDEEDFGDDHLGMSADEMLADVERLRPTRFERVVTHGDFSLGNVLIGEDGRVTGLIDVGRLGVADPYQDIAILCENLRDFGEEWPTRFLRRYGIETPDARRMAFHRALDELF